MRPDFLIAGVMKSGTTFLDGLIRNHHSIKMLERNLNYSFFDDDRIYRRGIEWYENLFKHLKVDKGAILGQTSADCYFNEGSIERIREHLPDIKLIFVLRDPIERAYSLYWHQYGMGREYRSFEDALQRESEVIWKSYYNYKMFSYIERSRYKSQFEKVFDLFDEKKVLLLPFNSLIGNTLMTINKVFDFLSVDRVENLDELDFRSIPRNPARIPRHSQIVHLSYYLQKMGMTSLGRRLVNLDKITARPPRMKSSTRISLEKKLAEDILFFRSVEEQFENY